MKSQCKLREVKREARHIRLRKKVTGTAEKPRLFVHRSLKNFHAQIIDDTSGKILLGLSTLKKNLVSSKGSNKKGAEALGEAVAAAAKNIGISKVCFDRGGYAYHGRVKAFAEAARKAGLDF